MNIKSLFLPMLLSVLFLVSSCKDEFALRHSSHLGDEVVLKISPSIRNFQERSLTRTSLKKDEEERINDVYCLIFSSDGKLFSRYTQDDINGLNPFEIKAPFRGGFSVVVFANVLDGFMAQTSLKADLDAVENTKQLKDIYVKIIRESIYPDEGFLMYGIVYADAESGTNITSGNTVEVPIMRSMAKIKFDVEYEKEEKFPNGKVKLVRRIIPKSWQVFNLPSSVQLKPGGGVQKGYFNSDEYAFEDNGFAFTFYSLPNTKKGLSDPPQSYKQRELQHKVQDDQHPGYVKNGAFVYAPENSTYVVLNMEYDEIEYNDQGQIIERTSAPNARYTIHLGGVSEDWNNWEVNEGTYYKYKVTIKGVQEVIQEVMKYDEAGAEINTGYEGEIMVGSISEVFDANYETTVVNIKKSDVGNDPFCYAFTPYCQGGDEDVDWVEFAVNKTDTPILRDYADAKKNNALLKPKEFLAKLKDGSLFNGKQDIYVSVYINEYYYEERPKAYHGNIEAGDSWAERGWTTFVNQPDRILFVNYSHNKQDDKGRKYSYDRKSSYDQRALIIRQKSIYTPYSTDMAGVYDQTFRPNMSNQHAIAFGMEVIENQTVSTRCEAPTATFGYDGHRGEIWKGLENSFYILWNIHNRHIDFFGNLVPEIGKMPWKNFVTIEGKKYVVEKNSTDWSATFQSQYACWTKNRDTDGDGMISTHEAKWYLPATGEICLLGIADPAIPFEYRLSIPEPITRFRHYMTSTRAGSQRLNLMTYYAEAGLMVNEQIHDPQLREDAATGAQYHVYDYVPFKHKGTYYYALGNDNEFSYRCLRLLGVKPKYIDELQKEKGKTPPMPQATKLWSYTGNGTDGSPYCIHLKYLDSKALRPEALRVKGSLPSHRKNSIWNRPMREFYVARQTITDAKGVGQNGEGMFYEEVLREKPCEKYREKAGGREDGWRLPNATELYLMSVALVTEDTYGVPVRKSLDQYEDYGLGWKNVSRLEYDANPSAGVQSYRGYFSSTEFYGNDGTKDVFYRYALIKGVHVPSISLVRSNTIKCYVRCVKDK